jgi:hypothetical protein
MIGWLLRVTVCKKRGCKPDPMFTRGIFSLCCRCREVMAARDFVETEARIMADTDRIIADVERMMTKNERSLSCEHKAR